MHTQRRRTDLALVFGHVAQDSLFIDAPIEKDPASGFCMRVAQGGGGKKAQTQVEVLERGHFTVQGPHWNAPVTKLRLKPITGRRHQLRSGLRTWDGALVCWRWRVARNHDAQLT